MDKTLLGKKKHGRNKQRTNIKNIPQIITVHPVDSGLYARTIGSFASLHTQLTEPGLTINDKRH